MHTSHNPVVDIINILKKTSENKYQNLKDLMLQLKNYPKDLDTSVRAIDRDYAAILGTPETYEEFKAFLKQLEKERAFMKLIEKIDECYLMAKRYLSQQRAIEEAEKQLAKLQSLDPNGNYEEIKARLASLKQPSASEELLTETNKFIETLQKNITLVEMVKTMTSPNFHRADMEKHILVERGKSLIDEIALFTPDEKEGKKRTLQALSKNLQSLELFVKNLEEILSKEIEPIRLYASSYIQKTVARLPKSERTNASINYNAQLAKLDSKAEILKFTETLRTSIKEAEQKVADDISAANVSQKGVFARAATTLLNSLRSSPVSSPSSQPVELLNLKKG